MAVLQRIKKNQIDGFKDFVKSLETTSELKRREIVNVAILEDPVYVSWVLKNTMSYKIVMECSSDDLSELFKVLPNGPQVFAQALYKADEEEAFRETVPVKYKKEYEEELEFISQLTRAQQESARFLIIRTIRDMQEEERTYLSPWRIPDAQVLSLNPNHTKDGLIEIKYDNDIVAARGSCSKTLRIEEWSFYYPNNSDMARGSYEAGYKIGTWTFWYANGNKKAAGEFLEDLKTGPWKEWDADGKDKTLHYKKGKVIPAPT